MPLTLSPMVPEGIPLVLLTMNASSRHKHPRMPPHVIMVMSFQWTKNRVGARTTSNPPTATVL